MAAVAVVLPLLFAGPRAPGDVEDPEHPHGTPHVLVLNSYNSGNRYTRMQEDGIAAAMRRDQQVSNWMVYEDLDAQPGMPEGSARVLAESIRLRFAKAHLHAVITTDTFAMRFLLDQGNSLFPGVPLVFCAATEAPEPGALGDRPATGVVEQIDIPGTLQLITQLQPDVQRIVAVLDGQGQYIDTLRATAQKAAADLPADVHFEMLGAGTTGELIESLHALGPRTAVLYLAFIDPKQPWLLEKHLPEIFSTSGAPVYGLYDSYIGLGIVGGRVSSGELLGRAAGRLAMRVLDGEPASAIPIERGVGLVHMFDHRELQRWGIPLSRLPAGSDVRFAPSPFYVRYWRVLLWGGGALVVQFVVIGAMLYARAIRRRGERAVAATRERLELAVDGSQLSIWDWDVGSDRTVWQCHAGFQMYGAEPGSPTQPWAAALHPEDRDRVQQALDTHLRDQAPYQVEYRLRMADGEYRWFRSSGRAVRDASGRPIRMTGTLKDVHERAVAQALLAESEAHYRVLVEASGDLVSLRGADGRVVYVSPSCERFFGASAADLSSSDWRARVHPDDMDQIEDVRRRNLAGEPVHTQYRAIARDGRVVWMDLRTDVVRDAAGRVLYMLSVSRDVSERAEQERRTRESELRYRAMFDQSPLAFLVYRLDDYRILDANKAAEQLYGYSREELLARTAAELRPPEDVPAFLELHRAAEMDAPASSVVPPHAGWRHRCKDGRLISVEVSGQSIELDGRPARLVLVRDVTEPRRVQRILAEQNRILEMIAGDTPLPGILEELVRAMESIESGLRGSVMLLNEDHQTVRTGAAPGLPEDYCRAIDGLRIGPAAGSCGTAMWRHERVITTDIMTDPLWDGFRERARPLGLRSCWSEPIMSSRGQVLGSFAVYSSQARSPSDAELRLLTSTAHLAGIAIERRRLEAALAEAESRFRALFQQASVGIARLSTSGEFLMVNRRAAEIFGRPIDDLLGRSILNITHPDDAERNRELMRQPSAGGDGYALETRYLRPDESVVWGHVSVRIIRNTAGEADYLIAAIQDVTDRVEAEQRLARSEERYRRLLGDVRVVAWEADPVTWRFTFISGRAEEILGYPREDWLAEGFWKRILHPDDRDRAIGYCMSQTAAGSDHEFEYRAIRRDGREVWLRDLVSVAVENGRPVLLRGVIIDVTEQKRAERELERFFALSPGMLCVADFRGRFVRVNPAFARTLRYADGELDGREYLELIHPDDREPTSAIASRVEAGHEVTQFENRYRCADGSYRWLSWRSSSPTSDGSIYAAARDETEEKAAADALRRSETKYRQIIETAEEGVWVVDDRWRTTFVNARLAEMLGRRVEAMLGRHIFEFMDDEGRRLAAAGLRDRDARQAAHQDFRLKRADGTDLWVLVSTNAILDDDGRLIGALAMLTDITERRAAEQALRESEATNRALLAALPDSLFRVDADGRYLDFKTPPGVPLLVPPDQFLGRTMREVLPAEIAEPGMRALAAAMETGQTQVYEYQTVRGDRRRSWECRVVRTSPQEALIVVRDVTQRHEAEEALRDSQRRLSLLINQSPFGVIVWNTRFEIVQWNPAAQRIFGYSAQEAVGRHGEIIIPSETRRAVDEIWRALMTRRGGSHSIDENLTKSGDRVTCEWNNTPLVSADGAVIGVSSFVQDVTERVMSERRQALMMQELDHRVKNNMAAVLSLAEQTGRTTANFDDFLNTFMGRIRALTRMHTVLASSRWRGADLRSLIKQAVEPYSGVSDGRLIVDGPEVTLPPRAAQSLAMTLNELATNAAKYGALSVPAGCVSVRWTSEPAGVHAAPTVHLEWVERGGPITSAPQRRGLGIDLIEGAIIYQLGGGVTFRFPAEGLECTVHAPLVADEGANPVVTSAGVR